MQKVEDATRPLHSEVDLAEELRRRLLTTAQLRAALHDLPLSAPRRWRRRAGMTSSPYCLAILRAASSIGPAHASRSAIRLVWSGDGILLVLQPGAAVADRFGVPQRLPGGDDGRARRFKAGSYGNLAVVDLL